MGRSKFLDSIRNELRRQNYSWRTVNAYVGWARRLVRYCGYKHPRNISPEEIASFLNYLAVQRQVAASTQNQALCALVFLYREVLDHELPLLENLKRAKKPRRLPVVLTREEVKLILCNLDGIPKLVAQLLYGSGLRISEALRLRVQDVDLSYRQITVRSGKGDRDRHTVLPAAVVPALKQALARRKVLHDRDTRRGCGRVVLPKALARKYPGEDTRFRWQYLFPSRRVAKDAQTGILHRYHLSDSFIQRAVKEAVDRSGIAKRASCHTFRHSFATHLLQDGYDIRTVQELLGHNNVKTTMVYTHVLNKGGRGVNSPVDNL
ncbi:MAG: integron integrase [Balneolaceae bacterium]|nr:integron integrase [Balneolaceae bacterium]